MYKHILIPTDGSALSREAVTSGIQFAKSLGATVVGIHVIPVPHADQLEAWMHHDPNYTQRRQAMYDKFADEYLAFIQERAQAEQVPCICKKVKANEPWLAIVTAAVQERCDLIYISSHGWQGGEGQLLGSETLKVLHYSKLPVLVHKPAGGRTNPGDK